ncbi:hypothetical protein [Verrucomicrobium sp. GAS474]|uniref:hypothetical protein n=1 Tax=Verrucomicrobium sp. GAS474 TaxID=1882831 RepID=UPI0012FFC752|nr:hypothetical protein [Verrucomicrobium sp. GAS474]
MKKIICWMVLMSMGLVAHTFADDSVSKADFADSYRKDPVFRFLSTIYTLSLMVAEAKPGDPINSPENRRTGGLLAIVKGDEGKVTEFMSAPSNSGLLSVTKPLLEKLKSKSFQDRKEKIIQGYGKDDPAGLKKMAELYGELLPQGGVDHYFDAYFELRFPGHDRSRF